MWGIKDIITNITIFDIIDIFIVAYLFYNAYLLIKETRAEQLIKGIIILLLSTKISELLQLQVVHWILQKTMTVGIIALLIVFQPELRRALEQLGRTKFMLKTSPYLSKNNLDKLILEFKSAISILSEKKIGALIVFEKETGLSEIANTGTLLNAVISRQLILNLFEPNTPLHDGAIIIRSDKVLAAGCFLPLTENNSLNQEVGTRHRAALGVSEKSDAVAIVVSEETGNVSVAESGRLFKNLSEDNIERYLRKIMSVKIGTDFLNEEKEDVEE